MHKEQLLSEKAEYLQQIERMRLENERIHLKYDRLHDEYKQIRDDNTRLQLDNQRLRNDNERLSGNKYRDDPAVIDSRKFVEMVHDNAFTRTEKSAVLPKSQQSVSSILVLAILSITSTLHHSIIKDLPRLPSQNKHVRRLIRILREPRITNYLLKASKHYQRLIQLRGHANLLQTRHLPHR